MQPHLLMVDDQMIAACVRKSEFLHISIDGTMKILQGIYGQEAKSAPFATRRAAAVPDRLALRRALTIKGRTGALPRIPLVRDESTEDVTGALVRALPSAAREQVCCVATDDPSVKLFHGLRSVLQVLQAI